MNSRTCALCADPIIMRQRNAIYCSRFCANKAASRKRDQRSTPERAAYARAYYHHPDRLASFLIKSAKQRAGKVGVVFQITTADIVIPELCPVLGMPLERSLTGKAQNNSPSLDRIVPSLGYIKENIRVISNRANTLKRDATLDELQKLVEYLKAIENV